MTLRSQVHLFLIFLVTTLLLYFTGKYTENIYLTKTSSPLTIELPVVPVEQRYTVGSTLVSENEYNASMSCMIEAIWWEARGEGVKGQQVVAQSVMNRLEHRWYKNTVCGVVRAKVGKACAYSYYCDGKSDRIRTMYFTPKQHQVYVEIVEISKKALNNEYNSVTVAKYYKRCDYESKFFDKLKYLGAVGNHCLYDDKERG